MAERNRVPGAAESPIPITQPPPPRFHPTMQAGPESTPEELHGTIGPARNPLEAPALSAESRLAEAAESALLSTAAASSLPAMLTSDAANLKVNGPAAAALGLMTYGRSAARLADPRRALRSLARNPNYGAHALKRRTGYERGLFGLGVETHGDATLKPSTLFAPGRVEGRMRDLAYMHRDVEVAYPGMENIPVRVIPDAEWRTYVDTARVPAAQRLQAYGANGFLEHGNGITIRGRLPDETMSQWFSRADDTLVHEMQHIAQEADAIRAPYARPTREAYLADAREVEARNTAGRRVFSGDERYQFLRRATQDMPVNEVHLDNKGGTPSRKFKGWKAYASSQEAEKAEADAVAFVNEGIIAAPELSAQDLEDSRRSAAWLKANAIRKGLIKEGTLAHTGRSRFYSRNGFMENDPSFQGDRYSITVPVDLEAYRKSPETYRTDGEWAIIPSIYPDADGVTRMHTSAASEEFYRKHGGHFGIYRGVENANFGAEWDHHTGNAEWAAKLKAKQDAKGGENNFGSFTNFLASDDVPESIFGIPIVQDESRYTERDIEFFKENPKAAGFYDMGDEEDMGSQEAWGGANTVERVTHDLPRSEPRLAPRERPVMRAAEASPRAVLSAPAEKPSLWEETEEEFWQTIPGANSTIPEMREYARSPENLLPEELARLKRIRLRNMAIESGMMMATGVPASAKAAPVLLNDFRTGKYYRVPSLQVGEADVEAAARHFEKPTSQIMPSDYAAWVNYELNGRKLYQYSQNVLGSDADVAIMNQPADIARRLMRMKGSASVDAFRSAGIRQISVLPRVRPVTPLASDPPVLSPVEYQAWRDLRVLPLSSFYGNAYEAGVRTPFRASTHVDMLTPFRRLPASGGRDYLEVLSEYDGLPLATKNAVREGLAHQHFIDLHVDPGAEVQAVRFGWQDKLNDPNVFLGGRSINPDTVFGGRLKAATENDKGGESKKTARPTKSRGKYPGVANNPGNVEKHERRTDKTLFDGEIGGGKRPRRFANFDDPVKGLNAMASVLARRANQLAKDGRAFTIENYVPTYAPASENDVEGYIRNLSRYSGFARDAELDRWNADGMAKLLKAAVRFESGKPNSDWFTDEEYRAAAERLQEGAFD